MEPYSIDQYNHHRQLLSLLKERTKEHPDLDQKVEKAVLDSNNKQDYLDIANRISLNKNNSSNLIMEIIAHSRETGKYGMNISHLEDLNKPWDQRLRIYLVGLNKNLKEISDNCVTIWKCFKKTKERLSSFGPKKEEESTNIMDLMKKIRSFKEDLEGEVYTISKTTLGQPKTQSVQKSNSKIEIQSSLDLETAKELQQLKRDVAALHDFSLRTTISRGDNISKEETYNLLSSLRTQMAKLHEAEKHVGQPVAEHPVKTVAEHPQIKDQVLSLLTRFFSTRSLPEMKIIEKELQSQVGKLADYIQLKQSLKFFIRDKESQEEVSSPTLQKISPSVDVQQIQQLESQLKELRSKNLHLQQEVNKSKFQKQSRVEVSSFQDQLSKQRESQAKLEQENKRLQGQVNELKKELDERLKFSHLDRSRMSNTSQETELLHYEESARFNSPAKSSPESKVLREYSSPGPDQRPQTVIMEVVEKYALLEQNLRKQIQQLTHEKGILATRVTEALSQTDEIRNELKETKLNTENLNRQNETLRRQLEVNSSKIKSQHSEESSRNNNPWMQTFFAEQHLYKAEIQKLKTEIYEYKTYLQQFWTEKRLYQQRISLQNAKIHELQQTVSHFFVEESAYRGQIVKYQNELQRNQGALLESQENANQKVGELQQRIETMRSISSQNEESDPRILQAFFIEQKLYQGEIQKLRMENVDYKAMLDQFFIEIGQYNRQLQLYRQKLQQAQTEIESLKVASLQAESSQFHRHHEKIEVLLANEEVLKADIRRLKESLNNTNTSALNPDIQHTIEIFWMEQKKYQHRISQLTQKNHELQQMLSSFFIEQSLYQVQLQQSKNRIAELEGELEALKRNRETISSEVNHARQEDLDVEHLRQLLQEKEAVISHLQSSLSQQIGNPNLSSKIIQKAKLLKKENTILEKIQKSKGQIIEQMQAEIQNLKISIDYYRQASLFQADIFQDNESQKSVLIDLVTSQTGRTIAKTKLLFKYDPLSKVSFHSYIDNHESILVIVKTEHTIIGGYYEGAICEHPAKDKSGFLYSLDERQCYPCRVPEKAVTYDKYFIILGNSQVRLNVTSQDLFSNFAVSNAYYDKRQKNIDNFLRIGKARQTKFIFLEVYQVLFEESLPVQTQPVIQGEEGEDVEILS